MLASSTRKTTACHPVAPTYHIFRLILRPRYRTSSPIAHGHGAVACPPVCLPACPQSNFLLRGTRIQILTVINPTAAARSYHITIDRPALDATGAPLAMGGWRDADGVTHRCLTFVVLAPPRFTLDVAEIVIDDVNGIELSSDIVDVAPFEASDGRADLEMSFPFPLQGRGPFLCTQASGGG